MTPSRIALVVAAVLLVVAGAISAVVLLPRPLALPPPTKEVGRPILVITEHSDPFTEYYAEILRAEGLSAFDTVDITELTQDTLDGASVALMGRMALTQAAADQLTAWVDRGGALIAVRPDPKLADLFGILPKTGSLTEAYLKINTEAPPGQGLTSESIQFHGKADLFSTRSGTGILATLYSDAKTSTNYPAVTMRVHDRYGGHAVAFTYDLARSIVRLRQGNPAWAGKERDGLPPNRPDDLFFGKNGRDYVDLSRVAIPQADEQQRLLANILLQVARDDTVLPRFWYFPKGAKAVLVLAADDHNPGEKAREALAYQATMSAQGCSVENWECIRSTSLMYSNGSLTDKELASYHAIGFDFGVHVSTGCRNWTGSSLRQAYEADLDTFRQTYPSLPEQTANRIHCVAWSDYVSGAKIGRNFGLRLDLNYYYWPAKWVRNRPGFFTGSGIPMRFADTDGSLIDVYQAPTHLVNESGMDYPQAIDLMLDRALDSHGYYGAFGTHYDYSDSFDRQLIEAASRREVPMVSAAQLTEWMDARNASTFAPGTWTGSEASFEATIDPRARQLMRGMLPFRTNRGTLASLTQGGQPVTFDTEVVKGIAYAMFTATSGSYAATYVPDTASPTATGTSPEDGGTLPGQGSPLTATFSEPLDPKTVSTRSVRLLDAEGREVPRSVSYAAGGTTVRILPQGNLPPGDTFQLQLTSDIADPAGNAMLSAFNYSFTAPDDAASLWAPTEPTGASVATVDNGDVELGVRFLSDTNGTITGIRFYKGTDGFSEHTAALWDRRGQLVATTKTSNETGTGWQTATFATPVPIIAGRIYTASYRAPLGNYAYLPNGLAKAYTNGPLTARANGGVFRYDGGFPTKSSEAKNYLVDVAFRPA